MEAPATRCDQHPHKHFRREYKHHKLEDGRVIYETPEWKRIRKARLQMNPLCQSCIILDIIKPAKDVDHIVEIEDGGEPFDFYNTQSLCRSCHNRKTAMSKRNRNASTAPKLSDF